LAFGQALRPRRRGLPHDPFRSIAAGIWPRCPRRFAQAQIAGTKQLILPHRQAAGQLAERFGKASNVADLRSSGFRRRCFPASPATRFQRRNAGRDPGKAVGRALFLSIRIECTRVEPRRLGRASR
jgi:hypothetical protein